MQEMTKFWLQKFTKLRTQRRRAYAIFTALAILVSIFTTYFLARPAATMTAEIVCGLEEHIHTESCYADILVCGMGKAELPLENDTQITVPPAAVESPEEEEGPQMQEDVPEDPPPVQTVPPEVSPAEGALPPEEDTPSEEATQTEESVPVEEGTDKEVPPCEEKPSTETPQPDETPPEKASVQEEISDEAPTGESLPAAADTEIMQARGTLHGALLHYTMNEEQEPSDAPAGELESGDGVPAPVGDSTVTDTTGNGEREAGDNIAPETAAPPEDADAPSAQVPSAEESGADGNTAHTHTEGCYIRKPICGKEEHTHEKTCYADYLEQGTMMMVLPEGTAIPDDCDTEYCYIDPDNRFGVLVYAPADALPEGAVLAAELLEEGSDAYQAAEEALQTMAMGETLPDNEPLLDTGFTYDGFVALDIRFLLDGREVEPSLPVYVCIHAVGMLPQNADPDSIAIQHHAEEKKSLGIIPAGTEVSVEVVADGSLDTGALETSANSGAAAVDIMAAFAVESFSTFTATYSLMPIPADDWEGWNTNDFYTFEVDAINHYEDGVDTILFYGGGNSVSGSGYFPADMDWTNWYGIRVENRSDRYQVIQRVVHNRYAAGSADRPNNNITAMGNQNPDGYILLVKGSTPILPYDEAAYAASKFMTNVDATDDSGSFIVVDGVNKYKPAADWPEGAGTDHTLSGSGDSAVLAMEEAYSAENMWQTMNTTVPAGAVQVVLYPAQWPDYLTGGAPGDIASVEENDAIGFQLFNYSKYINKTAETDTAGGWRDISRYFQFRGEEGTAGIHVRNDLPSSNIDPAHDADGFTKYHATVERQLDEDGYPVLDLTRNADGTARTDSSGNALAADSLLSASQRSLAYLFRDGDHAVSAYTPVNTILQYDEASGTYHYDSRENAVDFDAEENRFYVRNYVERNDDTASSDQDDEPYYDFLPFDHTGGLETASTSSGYGYQLNSADVDYWFGMRMDVDFYQVKDGQYKGSNMVFSFSGDDDVWVFLDGVLVLDLGGTHGMVTGSINFATGEVQQYLDWNGNTAVSGSDKYFATTIQECFDAAEATPNNGWKQYDAETHSGIFADYTPHTLSFFYLERGSSVANCMIDFNLPTVPEQSLTVTKEVEDPGNAVSDDTLYTFRILQEDGAPFVDQGTSYTLLENGVVQGTQTVTAEDGSFQLAAGQSAQFMQTLQLQPGVTSYLVEERLPNGEKVRYRTVAYQAGETSGVYAAETEGVAGESHTSYPTPTLSAEFTQMVTFTNTVKPGDLTLRKVVHRTDGMDAATTTPFTFAVTGPAGTYLTSTGEPLVLTEEGATEVSILPDVPLTIYGLPAGESLSVVETAHDGFAVRWKHDNATEETTDDVEVIGDAISGVPIGIGTTTTLTCTNTTGAILPNTGGTGNAVYTSSGIMMMLLGAGLLLVQQLRKKVFPKA